MTDLSTPIAASSLLMTMLALVYAAWSGAISSAYSFKYSTDPSEKKTEKSPLRRVLYFRALPLAAICWGAALVAVPRSLTILGTIGAPFNPARLDDVAAAYLFSHILVAFIAIGATGDARRLKKHIG